jgi:putative ABC transport system substrate-binding protein
MKKFIVFLVTILMFTLVACGLTESEPEQEAAPVEDAVEDVAEEPEPEVEEVVEEEVTGEPGREFTVGILSGAQIPAFELGVPGFEERLTELLEAEGMEVNFVYQNAAGDPAMSTTIANTFASQQVDLIFSLGTSASQQALPVATNAEIPLVYGIITDPVGAGLVTEVSTGSSSALPMETQIDLLEELLGSELNAENRVAFLYTTDEDNSVASLGRLEAVAPEGTIVPFGIPANGLEHLTQHFINIAADTTISAIYIPQDNQITGQIQMVQNMNRSQNPERRLPVVVADLPIVEGGALASLSVDFAANGAAAADIAFDILVNGIWPDDFYSPTAASLALYLNESEAEAIGFTIPDSLTGRADRTF